VNAQAPLLDVDQVSVQFGGLMAVDGASLRVDAGQITGLIGPNGAGKTTLFNVITGLQVPTVGRVCLDGLDITRKRPYRRARLGIARTFQRLEAFGSLTARENVLVALEMRRRWATTRYHVGEVADSLLERVGIASVAHKRVELLPPGTARLVEVARALATDPKVLLLDEPSSGLDRSETDVLAGTLREVQAERNMAILLVEHDVDFVRSLVSRVFVLDFGTLIAAGATGEVFADAAVKRAYLGEMV